MPYAALPENEPLVPVFCCQQPVKIQGSIADGRKNAHGETTRGAPLRDGCFIVRLLGRGLGQGYFTSMRWRTIILILVILIGLPVYIWAAMAALSLMPSGWPVLIKTPFYLIAGILWAFFLPPLFKWSAKDPNSQFEPK